MNGVKVKNEEGDNLQKVVTALALVWTAVGLIKEVWTRRI